MHTEAHLHIDNLINTLMINSCIVNLCRLCVQLLITDNDWFKLLANTGL